MLACISHCRVRFNLSPATTNTHTSECSYLVSFTPTPYITQTNACFSLTQPSLIQSLHTALGALASFCVSWHALWLSPAWTASCMALIHTQRCCGLAQLDLSPDSVPRLSPHMCQQVLLHFQLGLPVSLALVYTSVYYSLGQNAYSSPIRLTLSPRSCACKKRY